VPGAGPGGPGNATGAVPSLHYSGAMSGVSAAEAVDLAGLGRRVRELRQGRGLTLASLAALSGVSRSMLSEVERGTRVPTVLTLDRIATGLGASIARLLREELQARVMVLRRGEQDVVRDPSGWERRVLSPVLRGVEFEFMRTVLGAGVDAGTFVPHAPGSREYLAVERGTLRLSLDDEVTELGPGDSVYYAGDCRHGFLNPADEPCVYYLAMDVDGGPGDMAHRPQDQR
jgi:transcriptional regulator with XRE-family HTH domain